MDYPSTPSGCLIMVSYAKSQSAKNRKNNILHSEQKKFGQVLKRGVWEVSWKCPPRDIFVQVNLSNVMDPFFGKLSICSWLQVSIECSHVWNRSLPKWEEMFFDVQKGLRSYFEILARGSGFLVNSKGDMVLFIVEMAI